MVSKLIIFLLNIIGLPLTFFARTGSFKILYSNLKFIIFQFNINNFVILLLISINISFPSIYIIMRN